MMWDNELVVWTEFLLMPASFRLAEIKECGCIHQLYSVDLTGGKAELGILRKLNYEVHCRPANEWPNSLPIQHQHGELRTLSDLRPFALYESLAFFKGVFDEMRERMDVGG